MSTAILIKPRAPTPLVALIPTVLRERPQWVGWRYEYVHGRVKPWAKAPINPKTAIKASATDPNSWASVNAAMHCYESRQLDGIGYVLTPQDGLVGIDLDGVSHNGALDEWAQETVMALKTYTEVSPSGAGLRLFVHGTLPRQGMRHGPVEAYQTARFLTMTGAQVEGTPGTIEARDLQDFCLRHFPPDTHQKMDTGVGGSARLTLQDYQSRLRRMLTRPTVASLWAGRIADYPSQSEADLALCEHLAYWLNGDRQAIDRAFRQSALYREEKWERASYREHTLDKAISLAFRQ